MVTPSGARFALLVALLSSAALPAFAQDAPPAEPSPAPPATGDTPPPVATEAATQQGGRSYTPADFARFAPRNALDMLNNVPGFSINEGDTERRGLGQATGNVLINGERYSGKSTSVTTELQRISASNVVRIEVVDAATLNISGLSGQVANVVTRPAGLSGNYRWSPQQRRDRTPARLLGGEVSLNGALGTATTYTLSLRNNSFRNGNAGPELVTDGAGAIIDRRDEVLSVNGDEPRLSGSIRHNFGDGSVLNLNAAGGLQLSGRRGERDPHRPGPGGPHALCRGADAGPQLRAGRRLRVRYRLRPAEADRAAPLHPYRVPPDPDPELCRRHADARPALRPERGRERDDRARRISLAGRRRRTGRSASRAR